MYLWIKNYSINYSIERRLKYADELNRDVCDLEAELEAAEIAAEMAVGGDTADVGAEIAAEMEAAEQAEATMENI